MSRVVIVGGGFAGLTAARELGRVGKLDVTLVDRRNHHLFQPLLYQVAMAGLSPAEIAAPIRALLRSYRRVHVRQDSVVGIDLEGRAVLTTKGRLEYEHLVLAAGAVDVYFGHDEWEEHAPGLKSIEQATEIRRRVLVAYERAETETDPARRKALLTFVVVGGGPTGVELAGALGEMSRFTLARDFRNIDPKLARVILVEAGPRILPGFSEKQASRAMRDLESIGVQVWISSAVTGIDDEGVQIGSERVAATTALWAAGVRASPLGESLGVPLDRQGRVPVEPDLSLKGHSEVFVVGDLAHVPDRPEAGGEPLPGLAPVALQQGRFAARSILRDLAGKARGEFRYVDKGKAATIGRSKAVVAMRGLEFGGFVAWLVWLGVHIYYLVGFKNRLFVVLQWGWAYLTFRRGARLIVGTSWRGDGDPERNVSLPPPRAKDPT